MHITASRIALPDLDQCVRLRTFTLVQNPAGDDDPLAQRFTTIYGAIPGQIVVERIERFVAKNRSSNLG
jgi:hypothetical protein